MEIQKIFSDEYDDERIYSVLMDEEELCLFSEVMDEIEDTPKKKSLLKKSLIGAGIGTGAVVGGIYGADAIGKHMMKSTSKKLAAKELEELTPAVLEKINKDYNRAAKFRKPAKAINKFVKEKILRRK